MLNKIYLNNFKISMFTTKNHTYVYIYNNTYYCLVKINKNLKVNLRNNKTLEIKDNTMKSTKSLCYFLKQFFFYEFAKIKFTGKGYKIKKNTKQSMVLLFNRAHTTTLWWKNIFIKKLKKYKIYIKYNNVQRNIVNVITGIRPINIFTKKGLRKSRQILFKKKGKK